MINSELLSLIKKLDDSNKKLQGKIKKSGDKISKQVLRNDIKNTSLIWFQEISPNLTTYDFEDTILNKYNFHYQKLIELSSKNSRRTTYLKILKELVSNFHKEILIHIVTYQSKNEIIQREKIMVNLSMEEKDYLNEAIDCANLRYFRAAIVLGWCAAINRIHNAIENYGFIEFSKKTIEMKHKNSGRYKIFNKSFDISNKNELSTIFDTDLLWIIEYCQFIDINQHNRLEHCFTMRNNSAHPGNAKITEANLKSFFSDIKTIIFDNPKLKI